jgi:hypothetical protein
MNAPALQTFDPARLPPIKTITATNDIHSFLQSAVPAELTRTALRRAWATDPFIRDFMGVAESQWNCNGAAAITGSGPLRTDQLAGLAESMLGSVDDTIAGISEACAPSPPAAFGREPVAE